MQLQEILSHANDYAAAALTVTVAVSSVIRFLGLAEKPWAKTVLSVCFDLGGALNGFRQARGVK